MCATAFSYARISAVYYCAVDLKTGVENAEKCKRIFQIDKNLYPTQFKFVQCSNSVDSEKLLKNFFKGVRAKNTE
jgi:tRNA(Arg) A34 adenosine deaminase TadA